MTDHIAWATLIGLSLLTGSAVAGPSNSLLDISADGALLATANRDNGTISLVELRSAKVLREIPVGSKPEGVSFLGDTHDLAVTVYGDDHVVILRDNGDSLRAIDVFDEPYGVVSTRDGLSLYVTLDSPGQLLQIDASTGRVLRSLTVPGAFLRGVALAPDDQRIYVSDYYSARILAIERDGAELRVVDEWRGAGSENLARQVTLHPERGKLYVPHIRSRTNVNQGEGSVVPFLSVIDTPAGEGRRRKAVPMDSFYSVTVVANPWETAISPDGRTLCAVFAGTDDMYVCDVLDDDYRELAYRRGVRLGHNPRAVRFAPDGERFYVYNTLDFEVACYETRSLKKQASIRVCGNPLGDEILRGKVLFYSALQPMVGRRWISCASCHPDGDGDNRTWQNPEGLRNTTALYGMAWTHPIHWSADRDESQDFEITIRSRLMQGRGLIQGPVNDGLAEPNKGRSADLDALAAYCNMHKVPLSPYAKGGLSAAAQRGRELFFATETRCAECHTGPYFTDSTPVRPFKLHDVGTGEDDPSEKMGPAFDTPTLLAVYRTAPYLHHGQAATLEEVLTTCNKQDRHGKTSHLAPKQIADLVEFLKSLPFEDPEPQAKAAGLTKIER